MRSSVRLIVPDVPCHDLLGQGALLARSREAFIAAHDDVVQRMAWLVASTRALPGGYPSLIIQRRTQPRSQTLRWLDARSRMMTEARFLAVLHALPARVRVWFAATHLEARWLNSQERICRLVSAEYFSLAEVLATSCCPRVPPSDSAP